MNGIFKNYVILCSLQYIDIQLIYVCQFVLNYFSIFLINSSNLPVDYSGYFMYIIILSINHGIFDTSFLILILFISFSCLTTLVRISFTKWSETDEKDIFAFFLSDHEEKACHVSHQV